MPPSRWWLVAALCCRARGESPPCQQVRGSRRHRENVDPATAAGKPAAICCARYKKPPRVSLSSSAMPAQNRLAVSHKRLWSAAGAGHPGRPAAAHSSPPLPFLWQRIRQNRYRFSRPGLRMPPRVITTDANAAAFTTIDGAPADSAPGAVVRLVQRRQRNDNRHSLPMPGLRDKTLCFIHQSLLWDISPEAMLRIRPLQIHTTGSLAATRRLRERNRITSPARTSASTLLSVSITPPRSNHRASVVEVLGASTSPIFT